MNRPYPHLSEVAKAAAKMLAVRYNAFNEASDAFYANPTEDSARSLRVWSAALLEIQTQIGIQITAPEVIEALQRAASDPFYCSVDLGVRFIEGRVA